MISVRILFLLLLNLTFQPLSHASLADDADSRPECETFLDKAARKLSSAVPPIRSHINAALLRNYSPQTTIAYGDSPTSIMEKLPNFVAEGMFSSSSELEEMRAQTVGSMIANFIPNWRLQHIWFFEAAEELSLFKDGDTLPTKFSAGTFVIMRGGYAFGRAKLEEFDTIEWL